MTRYFSVGIMALALAVPAVAQAQDSTDRAAAEALFSEGRRLMAAGDYKNACPKLASSQKLDRAIGTSLNLAECYEKSGRLASAWIEFRETASAARAAGSKDREQLARERAAALEKKLSYLTITTAAAQRDMVRVVRDGVAIDAAALGVPLPVDAGVHLIEVTAPGKKAYSEKVEVPATQARVTVEVPLLADAPTAVASHVSVGTEMPSPAPSTSSSSGNGQRILGASLGGLGVVATAVGVVFGLKASSDWSSAKSDCASVPDVCTGGAVSKQQDARSAANISTVAFAVGVAALAGGAVIYFTAPKGDSKERGLALQVSPMGALLSGHFE
jgi:hypothetical protein